MTGFFEVVGGVDCLAAAGGVGCLAAIAGVAPIDKAPKTTASTVQQMTARRPNLASLGGISPARSTCATSLPRSKLAKPNADCSWPAPASNAPTVAAESHA